MAIVPVGGLIQITDFQQYLGHQILNVYYYRAIETVDWGDNIITVLGDFTTRVIDVVRTIQSQNLVHEFIEARDLSSNLQVASITLSANGTFANTTENAPSSLCHTFRLQRNSLVTRNGYKRFAGVVEGQVNGNNQAAITTQIANIITALADNLEDGGLEVLEPVIVKRPINPPVGTTYAYSTIAGCDYRGVGTQNTRKVLRGSST